MVMVGGELTLSALDLTYSPTMGFYSAPVQAIANGGVLVIDDFGRQHCSPRDLLNRWIVPLESRMDFLTLQTGQKFHLPFMVLVVFATNIKPAELVDEAFLRRIHYKVFAESPTRADFLRIFADYCRHRSLAYDQALVEHLLDELLPAEGHHHARLSPARSHRAGARPCGLHGRATSSHLSATGGCVRGLLRRRRRIAVPGRLFCIATVLAVLAVAAPAHAGPRDEVAHAVRITSPLGRTGLDGRIRIVARVTAPEKAPVPTVRFYVNGELLATDSDGAPYVAEWEDLNPFEACALSVEADFGDTSVVRDEIKLQPLEMIETAQVMSVGLEATIVDARGRYIAGLEAADFELREDGTAADDRYRLVRGGSGDVHSADRYAARACRGA